MAARVDVFVFVFSLYRWFYDRIISSRPVGPCRETPERWVSIHVSHSHLCVDTLTVITVSASPHRHLSVDMLTVLTVSASPHSYLCVDMLTVITVSASPHSYLCVDTLTVITVSASPHSYLCVDTLTVITVSASPNMETTDHLRVIHILAPLVYSPPVSNVAQNVITTCENVQQVDKIIT